MTSSGRYLMDLISGTLSPSGENVLIHCGHQLATRYIEIKKSTGKLQLPIEEAAADIAWDAIAPIFELSSDRHFSKLRERLIAATSIFEKPDESDLLVCYRKIIHQAVSDEIFNYFREQDPTLARIIRNIKDIIGQRDDMEIRSLSTGKFVCLAPVEANSDRSGLRSDTGNHHSDPDLTLSQYNQAEIRELTPVKSTSARHPIDPDILCIKLWDRIRGSSIPGTHQFLDLVFDIMADSNGYNMVLLTGLALTYRELCVKKQLSGESDIPVIPMLTSDELADFINKTIRCLETNYYNKYVGRNKLSADDWHIYMHCFREIFLANYQESDTDGLTYFEVLKKSLPDLTPEQYREQYKAQFEYLISLMRTEFINHLKKEFNFGQSA